MINKVELIGRLGAEPEVTNLQNGTTLTKISVGTNEVWTDKKTNERKEETSWHNISFFGKTAENASRILQKGSLVFIEGKIKYNTVQKDDGSSVRYTDIQARDFRILADGKRNQNPEQNSGQNPGQNAGQQNAGTPQPEMAGGSTDNTDDDLPF
jgi:single-strand DNA-binding protein